jgi:hypothetical protein
VPERLYLQTLCAVEMDPETQCAEEVDGTDDSQGSADPRDTQEQWAIDEVFVTGDLVHSFKDCFTLSNFAFSKTALRIAKREQMDIKPVIVRANVDVVVYEKASRGGLKMRICDIEWPAHLHPTADFYNNDLMYTRFEVSVHHVRQLKIMVKMLKTHVADLRILKIRMSLVMETLPLSRVIMSRKM